MNTETKLWNKNFILYIIAFELVEMGSALLRFAIPVYILIATNDPVLLGTVMTLSWLPFVIFTPIGGVMADRFSKRHIIILFNFLIALTIGLYIVLTGNVDALLLSIVILVLMTILQSLQTSGFETALYEIIPMEKLMKANQVTWILAIGSGVLAPIAAGFMLSEFGLDVIVYAGMFLFLTATGLNFLLKIPFVKPEKTEQAMGLVKTVMVDLKDSFTFIWYEQETLKRATIALFLYSLVLFPLLSIIPAVLINTVLGMGERSLGFANGLIAAGGIFGVVILGRLGSRINITKLTHLLVVSSVLFLLTMGVFMVASNDRLAFGIITVGTLLVNTVLVMFSLNYFTYLGQKTPEDIVGKVMAFAMTVMMLGGTLAQFTVGRLFNLFGDHLALAAVALPIVVLILVPMTRMKEEGSI